MRQFIKSWYVTIRQLLDSTRRRVLLAPFNERDFVDALRPVTADKEQL